MADASKMEISGVVRNSKIAAPTDTVATLDATVLSEESAITANTGNYTLKLTGDMTGKTFTGTSGADTISIDGSASAMIIFNDTSDSDVIYGYTASSSTIKIPGKDYTETVNGSDKVITFGKNTLTLKDAANITPTIDEVRTADTFQTSVTVKNNILTASSQFKDAKIDLSEYTETITKVNANAVTQALTITATNTKGTSISGGKGANTIIGSTGNDTLKGNDGADVYIYGGGKDLIYYAEEDKIQLDFEKVESSTLKGSDAVLTLKDDGGTITLKSVKNKTITFVNGENETQKIFFNDTYYAPLEDGLTYNSSRTALTAANTFKGTEIDLKNYLDTVTKVNFAAATQGVSITGSANNDTITGGNGKNVLKGGAGNDEITGGKGDNRIFGDAGDDTLYGGTGNSTLTGGAGNDIFVYEGGNDYIADYTVGEEIQLSNRTITDSTEYEYSGKNLVFKFDTNNTLTIKNAKNKEITINGDAKVFAVPTATTQTNSQTYDLLYDNNFVTDEFGLDDITEQKFEVQNIETQNNLEIAQEQTILTYSTDK